METKKEQERKALHATIWKIANDLRGSVDGWDFKQYVLGTLFYRFISEHFALYIEADDNNINYAELSDSVITPEIKDDAIKTKGYFIYPSQLFVNVAKKADTNESLSTDLAKIFSEIESSANGYPSESDIRGLFADFDITSNRLGNTVKDKNTRLVAVLKGVAGLEFGDFHGSQIDLFGDAYEFLISNYAANAGKSGGEFFTPQEVSELLARITTIGKTKVDKVYDPTCGTGSLLIKFAKVLGKENIEQGFYGQEINPTSYNLCRMNMFLHNISYDKFNIGLGNTLLKPHFGDDKPFDAIVSNPPYSVKWIGSDDPTLIYDDRFTPAGVLAPKSKADLAFVMHILSCLAENGTAAIVCFPGMLYRTGAECKIRQYLVDNNFIDCVIVLPPNLFFGTGISTCILVIKKNKQDNKILFINACAEFEPKVNNNKLTNQNIEKILDCYKNRQSQKYFSRLVNHSEIAKNEYNISVSSYVEQKDNSEIVDISELNAEIKTIVKNINRLRADIDAIVAEIEA
jgi:type I restriction enzyme M protein